ncbi:MAG: DUF177 domain-containing protein [Gemmatimonadaceae bacterium]|nr:DUF177 domain-containing protein [Gemmatimonadaceae bacterium]
MLSFDLRSLESNAVKVEADLRADDAVWREGDTRPDAGVQVTGRLSAAGAGRFYFSGRLEGQAATSCRRCLDHVSLRVDQEVHLLLVDGAAEEADEPDVYLIDVRQHDLDLRPAIREEWLLAVPPYAVCSESCQGLCPKCGGNRNHGACTCTTAIDPRWGALSALRNP